MKSIRPLILLAALLPALVMAQGDVKSSRSADQSVHDDYHAAVKAQQAAHNQRIAELNQQYRDAMKAYSEENVRRSKALSESFRQAHQDLAQSNVKAAERNSEANRLQSENQQRRKEHAEWRDATGKRIRDEHQAMTRAQWDMHNSEMDRLLSQRNASLARLRGTDGTASVAPAGSTPAQPEGAPTVASVAPTTGAGDGQAAAPGPGAVADAGSGPSGAGVEGKPKAPTPTSPILPDSGTGSGIDSPNTDENGNFVWSDGSTARGTDRSGGIGTVNEKGDVVYPDGTTAVHTGDREVTVHRPDGSSVTQRAGADGLWERTKTRSAHDYPSGSSVDAPYRDEDTGDFVYGDDTVVRGVGPDGQAGKINDKGDIQYADGTTVVHAGHNEVVVHRPDGSTRTRRMDENGRWQTVAATKVQDEGKGSDHKYVGPSHGSGSSGGDGNSGSADGDSGKDTDDSGQDTDSNGSGGSGNDSDDSGSAEGGEGNGDSGSSEESSDGGKDAEAETDGDSTEYYGNGSGGRSSGPSDVVQGIVDRATGQRVDPESAVPEPCGESSGFGVTQPGPGSSGSCVPGHLPSVSTENDQQPDTPDAGASADADDLRRAGSTDIGGNITQPAIDEEGILMEDLPSGSALDQSPVVNPPQQ